MEYIVQIEFDKHGKPVPSLASPRGNINIFQEAVGNLVGDGKANGTALLTHTVAAGEVLYLTELLVSTKIAACTIYIVSSDTNGVGGVETLLHAVDIPNVNTISLGDGKKPVVVIDNTGGSAALYLVIYAPQARAGAATNNAVTQYWSAHAKGIVE